MSKNKPRAAYCTGCGVTFPKMHIMINHRRNKKCGGKWLPKEEHDRLMSMRFDREQAARDARMEADSNV